MQVWSGKSGCVTVNRSLFPLHKNESPTGGGGGGHILGLQVRGGAHTIFTGTGAVAQHNIIHWDLRKLCYDYIGRN